MPETAAKPRQIRPTGNGSGSKRDPSPNVLDLVDAESKYQDAARNAERRRVDDLRAADKELAGQRDKYEYRIAVQRDTFQHRLSEQRDRYERRIADMISSGGKDNSTLLATQLDRLANSLGQRIIDLSNSLGARITDLERKSWEVGGKTSVSDPATTETLARMQATLGGLSKTESREEGRGIGRGEIIALISFAVLVTSGIVGTVVALVVR